MAEPEALSENDNEVSVAKEMDIEN